MRSNNNIATKLKHTAPKRQLTHKEKSIIFALKRIATLREQLRQIHWEVENYVYIHGIEQLWSGFLASGGIDADDFVKFVNSDTPNSVIHRDRLRLVVSKRPVKTQVKRLRLKPSEPTPAA